MAANADINGHPPWTAEQRTHQSPATNDRDIMTNRHHQYAAAHPAPRDSAKEDITRVVDLVTMSRNLKTEDLKTVPLKKHTNSLRMPHFWCSSVGSVLRTLPPSDSGILCSTFTPEHRTLCPRFVRTNASFMRTNDGFMSTNASLIRSNASFVLVSQLTRPVSNTPFVHTNESFMRTNALFMLISHLIDPEIHNHCLFCKQQLSLPESITAKIRSMKNGTLPGFDRRVSGPRPSVKLDLMFSENGSGSLFSNSNPEWATAYCDGGSRGNPGPAGYGVFIEGANGEKLAELSEYLGKTTNNVAEYSALLGALDWALRQGRPRLRVVADSELLVKQIQGRYKVNSPDLRPLFDEAKRRIARLDQFRIEHVLRGKNQKADRLANLAMDTGMGRAPKTSSPSASSSGPGAGAKGQPQSVKGFVKGGVVHLIEGELPDGMFVKVTPDRQ